MASSDTRPTGSAGTGAAARSADPVTREIVLGSVRSIQGQMEGLIERTAMSAFIREKKDFHAGVFTARGKLIAGKAKPSASDLVTPIFEEFPPEQMKRGDIYWYNDCYAARGAISHGPDQCLIAPVFEGDTLVAFAQSWAHFTDIGGMLAGSISPQCVDWFQEGIIIPPVRLAREGQLNDDLLRMFIRNSRFPSLVRGDMRALIASVQLGERRIEELARRFGAAKLAAAFEDILARTSRVVRQRFRELVPDGSYRFTDVVDDDGHGSGPIRIRWKMEVTPDRVTLDATESDNQVRGPINYLMNQTSPAMAVGLMLIGDSSEYNINSGAEDLFDEVKVREGSILQPKFPAALGQRSVTMMRNVAAWMGLLGVASDGKASAAHTAYVIWNLRGRDENDKPFLMTDGVAVGYGARPFADGHDAIYSSDQENYPAEFVEGVYPFLVRTYAINADSGGPGRWRGGCGVVREVEVLSDNVVMAVRIEGPVNPPWGAAGGMCAGSGRCVINPGRADERVLAPLSDGNKVKRGDILRIETGGGGGWGHPHDREPERVLNDVLSGYVSRASAEKDYGVVLTADGSAVDVQKTQKARAARPAVKPFHRHEYKESFE
jgi:N-methylhydantoinase B